jgi:hypothetical protein
MSAISDISRRIRAMSSKVPPLRCDAMSTTRNRTTYRGVDEVKPGRFRATIGGDHPWRSQYFDTPREAARAYDRMARKIRGKLGFYNFPRPGERRVRPADPDRCCHGHSRAQHTYFRPSGGVGYCRACNKLAQQRAKARRKART